jgi:ATP-dependent 26S proteasome regulatory subunit
LIKNHYINLSNSFEEDIFNNDKFNETTNNILDILDSEKARKKSRKKLNIHLDKTPYKKFDSIINDLEFLDKILQNYIHEEFLNKETINFLYTVYSKNIKEKYKITLTENKTKFSKFLSKNEIKFTDLIIIMKTLQEDYGLTRFTLNISNELYTKFKDNKSMQKLLKKKIIKNDGFMLELSQETRKALLDIDSEDKESDNILITQTPTQTFEQVCLDDNIKSQILKVIDQHKNQNLIFNTWGLKDSIEYGKGITLNLSGPPGTGKTLSVRAIANYLKKELLTINYSQLESMWLGETEKNISQAFKTAKEKNAVLFFDEADSLTTKRENAQASWEISRTNTLLKELENFDGVCIFATNFAENYDQAFNRRLSSHIQFQLPKENQLKQILQIHFPKKQALSKNINFDIIAKKYSGIFSGGDIKNIVLNSARIAASDKDNTQKVISQNHLLEACSIVLNSKKHTTNVTEADLSYFR